MPTVYSIAMLAFFMVGAVAGGLLGYRAGQHRGTVRLRERVDESLLLLRQRMTSLEEATSVVAEAERLLRRHDNDKDGSF